MEDEAVKEMEIQIRILSRSLLRVGEALVAGQRAVNGTLWRHEKELRTLEAYNGFAAGKGHIGRAYEAVIGTRHDMTEKDRAALDKVIETERERRSASLAAKPAA